MNYGNSITEFDKHVFYSQDMEMPMPEPLFASFTRYVPLLGTMDSKNIILNAMHFYDKQL